MYVSEELVLALVAFLIAFGCWVLAGAGESEVGSKKRSGPSESSPKSKDIEDRW